MTFDNLIGKIEDIHLAAQQGAARSINRWLTERNWLVGYQLVEYEQNGQDRAEYGNQVLEKLAQDLKSRGVKGMSYRSLRQYRQFYLCYPQIWQTLSAKFIAPPSSRLLTSESNDLTPAHLLLERLSFSHFVELIKEEDPTKRTFYELQCLANNWTVRDLKRYMGSLLYERTGLSLDKEKMLAKLRNASEITQSILLDLLHESCVRETSHSPLCSASLPCLRTKSLRNLGLFIPSAFLKGEEPLQPKDILRSPYILDFLDLPEQAEFNENDLETALVNHLQQFLQELGKGFCFEARQKRITVNNQHFYLDLLYYHRILKCHVLIDLKTRAFSYADAGQMNLYLNYFREEEQLPDDNPPIGIILCTHGEEAEVTYATGGLENELFVSRYLVQLPTEEELKQLIEADLQRFKTS